MFCTQCGKNDWNRYYVMFNDEEQYYCKNCCNIQLVDKPSKDKIFSELTVEQKLKEIYNDIQLEIKNSFNEEKIKKM